MGIGRYALAAALGLTAMGCEQAVEDTSQDTSTQDTMAGPILDDPYIWLEEVEGEKALSWVEERNGESLVKLEAVEGFDTYRARAETILASKDRIAYPRFIGDYIYNFWQDDTHVRGIWRRTTLASYETETPDWETVLDIDALAEEEGENWVWKGYNCRTSDYRRCLISLSRGGKDAVQVREFDLADKSFVEGGFKVEEAKSWYDWYDNSTLMMGTDYGPQSQTESGYPRIQKLWPRGTALSEAKTIAEVPATSMVLGVDSKLGGDRKDRTLIHSKTFWTAELSHIKADGSLVAWPLPDDADYKTMWNGRVIALLRTSWTHEGVDYPRGSLIAYAIDPLVEQGEVQIEQIYAPKDRVSIQSVSAAKTKIYITVLDNVTGKLLALSPSTMAPSTMAPSNMKWHAETIDMPENGTLSLVSTDTTSDRIFVNYEGFLTPDSLYLVSNGDVHKVKALPNRFNTDGLSVTQSFATSKDGTKVPYFLVMPKDAPRDGTTPVWLWSYGGFEAPLTPRYVAPGQQFWLEEGGAYVVANIRGGGEFGPKWHQAALLKNRQRAYDDLIAVSEDLIERKITSPAHLGVSGRSNGGLLTGVQITQRPDLYNAVIIGVPLLDMLRYDRLLAGASWVGEYGDPDDPEMRDYILTYSPYQNLDANAEYPTPFIYTSTKDDRVHPGHARKFAARMKEQGHDFLYYENTEGGHAGVANLKQNAYRTTLELVYMQSRLR